MRKLKSRLPVIRTLKLRIASPKEARETTTSATKTKVKIGNPENREVTTIERATEKTRERQLTELGIEKQSGMITENSTGLRS